jgi:hypothetical protein
MLSTRWRHKREAQSLMHRRASRKTLTLGTRRSIWSVTRDPDERQHSMTTLGDWVGRIRYLPDFGCTGHPNCAEDYHLAR